MALVYRVLNSKGSGMYQGGFYYDACTDENGRSDDDAHTGHIQPDPHGDSELRDKWCDLDWGVRSELLFGFSSLEQLQRWIHKHTWRKKMNELGGKIAVFEVPDDHLLTGECQVVFNPQAVTHLHNLNVETFEVLQ